MKRLLLPLLLLLTVPVFSQDNSLELLGARDTRTLALGGVFEAMSEGYRCFLGNPAAYSVNSEALTIPFASLQLYSPLAQNDFFQVLDLVQRFLGVRPAGTMDPLDLPTLAEPYASLISGNGLGAGLSFGFGWIGEGLAFGLSAEADGYLQGVEPLLATGRIDVQVAAVVGFVVPIPIAGLDLSFGGNVRPFWRLAMPYTGADLFGLTMTATTPDPLASAGFGLAADLGLRLELFDDLAFGLSVRDITTDQLYKSASLDAILGGFGTGIAAGVDVVYHVLPELNVGLSLRPIPQFLWTWLELLVVVEAQDVLGVLTAGQSALAMLHAGVELGVLNNTLTAQFGFSGGAWSFGLGLDFLALEGNLAFFAEPVNSLPGSLIRTGFSLDFAIRF